MLTLDFLLRSAMMVLNRMVLHRTGVFSNSRNESGDWCQWERILRHIRVLLCSVCGTNGYSRKGMLFYYRIAM